MLSLVRKKALPGLFSGIVLLSCVHAGVCAVSTQGEEKEVEAQATKELGKLQVKLSGHMGLGYLDGESSELVYDRDGSKVSELTWTLENICMLNLGGTIEPSKWFKVNADLWMALNEGDGTLDDYDWLYTGSDWSDWSHHDDVPLDDGIMFDVNLEAPFYSIPGTTFSAFLGLKYENWCWKAYGGDFVYSYYGFRDYSGSFDDGELGITYEQTWTTPYIGLGFESRLSTMDLSGRFIFSPLAQGEDEDTHHLRDLYFEDDFDNTTMYGLDLEATYRLTERLDLTGQLKYHVYEEAEGTTTVTDITYEPYYSYSYTYNYDAAGADNEFLLLSLFLTYHF